MSLEVLKTKIIGKRILFVDEIGSTNDEARRLAAQGEKEGSVVVANSQTKGRGRLGRRWISPPGGLYLSVILKPYVNTYKRPLITLFSSLAVVRTLRGLTKLDVAVKWPNDIVIDSKKIGGVLSEGTKGTIIVGIGVNLNANLGMFPSALKKQITSLKFELGESIDKDKVIKIFLEEYDKLYIDFLHRRYNDIIFEWSSYCQTLGQEVRIESVKGEVKGFAEAIGRAGELIVRGYDGKIKKVFAADITKVNIKNI